MAKVYHKLRTQKYHERLRKQLKTLPPSCADFFRAISQTTSPLTRLAYAYDLNLFFRFLCTQRVSFANSSQELMSLEEIASITARDIEAFQEYLMFYTKTMNKDSGSSHTLYKITNLALCESCVQFVLILIIYLKMS